MKWIKILMFLISVLAVAYVFLHFKVIQDDYVSFYMREGHWTEVIFLFCIGYLISRIFEWLLRWGAKK